jgi:hypothetical protein
MELGKFYLITFFSRTRLFKVVGTAEDSDTITELCDEEGISTGAQYVWDELTMELSRECTIDEYKTCLIING